MVTREALLDLMNEAEAVYLATMDGAMPRVRALVNLRRRDRFPGAAGLCRREGFTCYLSTSLASDKLREIRANPAASLYYSEPRTVHGIMLSGRMEILADPELKRTLWSDEWRIYWPAGPADPDYVILRLRPTEATGWWGTQPFDFEVTGS